MNDIHDVITVGIPLIAILAGILFSRSDIKELRAEVRSDMKDLRAEMSKRFDKVDGRLDVIDSDMRQFYHLTGKLEARVEAVEKRGA